MDERNISINRTAEYPYPFSQPFYSRLWACSTRGTNLQLILYTQLYAYTLNSHTRSRSCGTFCSVDPRNTEYGQDLHDASRQFATWYASRAQSRVYPATEQLRLPCLRRPSLQNMFRLPRLHCLIIWTTRTGSCRRGSSQPQIHQLGGHLVG